MNDLDLCLEVVSRSRQSLRYIWRWISRKPLEIETWFQRTTNKKWHMGYRMVKWSMTSRDPKGAMCYEAVRLAILATAWLLVSECATALRLWLDWRRPIWSASLTAFCAVTCVQHAIFAPASGLSLLFCFRRVIIPHISAHYKAVMQSWNQLWKSLSKYPLKSHTT